MTAVIGILNKAAVAIAADSAVTVTGPAGPKIFNRANKIFTISKHHPVGMMIYNQGEFMGTGWEIVIKLFRTRLGDRSFPTLEEYKLDFIRFLHEKNFFCDVNQQKRILQLLISEFLRNILQLVINENMHLIQALTPNINQILFDKVVENIHDFIAKPQDPANCCDEFQDLGISEVEICTEDEIKRIITQVFAQVGIITTPTPDLIIKVKEYAFLYLKSKDFDNFFSGLVFVGYGEDEIFPRLSALKVSLALNNRLRYFHDTENAATISHSMESCIRPFAQIDVIDTILGGIDPGLYQLYLKQFTEFIVKNNNKIADLINPNDQTLADRIRALDANPLTLQLDVAITSLRQNRYISPMMGAVGTLSKEDLAEMAESLIYLTYLKRRFTFSEESVGGPVDVALITKGDGFIWMKRKHYFDPSLNHHFLKNY
jgi:hypothetical protein